jgi:ABC-type sugar transport system ATPase subunit
MSLEVRNLTKKYPAFSISVDFAVDDGEILVLAGPSGCGKTTVLNLIAGLLEPDEGSIIINGEDMTQVQPWKRSIGFVFQDASLFPHMDVGENVASGPHIRGMGRKEGRSVAREALRRVHLAGYENRHVDTLSGGEAQRVAIARALAASPRALLMDEPFSSLDTPLRKALRREFLELMQNDRYPVIFVTHDREEALNIGKRIALMKDGKVVEIGAGEELFTAPKTRFAAEFFQER